MIPDEGEILSLGNWEFGAINRYKDQGEELLFLPANSHLRSGNFKLSTCLLYEFVCFWYGY